MALPSMRPLYDRVYTIYAASLAAAASPSFVAAARGAVVRLHYTPLVAPASSTTNVTPQLNGTPMQLNGVNVAYPIPAGSSVNVDVGALDINGVNTVNEGDVVNLVSDGGATNAASVPGYYTVVVREASAAA